MPPRTKKHIIAIALGIGTCASLGMGLTMMTATPAQAQFGGVVFDPSNYAQNILTAARTLQTVNQQIQQLQNEAQMLVNMGKNLTRIDFPQLDALKQKLAEIDRLMGRAQAIDFRVDQLDDKFQSLFPQDFSSAMRTDARVREPDGLVEVDVCPFRLPEFAWAEQDMGREA